MTRGEAGPLSGPPEDPVGGDENDDNDTGLLEKVAEAVSELWDDPPNEE